MKNQEIQLLKEKIYQCSHICKKPPHQILVGRLLSGNIENVGVFFIGDAPNPNYGKRVKNRVVFGPYSNAGKKIINLIKEIQQRYNKTVSIWGTNVIKCDSENKYKKRNIRLCQDYLLAELRILNPKISVIFGGIPTKNLLGESLTHGKESLLFNTYPCVISYHPSSYAKNRILGQYEKKILVEKIISFL